MGSRAASLVIGAAVVFAACGGGSGNGDGTEITTESAAADLIVVTSDDAGATTVADVIPGDTLALADTAIESFGPDTALVTSALNGSPDDETHHPGHKYGDDHLDRIHE